MSKSKRPQNPTVASTQFDMLCASSKETNAQIGSRLGASPSLVSSIRLGVSSPRPPMRLCIETVYGVPRADWDVAFAPPAPQPDPVKEALRVIAKSLGYDVK